MATDIWNKDPEKWRSLSLKQRLEMLREYTCTGPSGSSASANGTQAAMSETIREAIAVLVMSELKNDN